jgi:hypothetical protein
MKHFSYEQYKLQLELILDPALQSKIQNTESKKAQWLTKSIPTHYE